MSDQIYITVQTVRDAADKLLYKGMFLDQDHPLLSLMLVDWICAAPGYPNTPISRSIALGEILTQMIRDRYYHHRQVEELVVPDLSMPKLDAIGCINEDVRTNNTPLIQWGWLYHRYVRVDLQLDLADVGKIDERTLRRHIRQGMQQLASRLIHEEKCLRQQHYKQRLYLQLPAKPQHLIGRNQLIDQLAQVLSLSPGMIQIVGKPGVGKRSLVRAVIHQLIDNACIDQLIWLDESSSSHHVLTTLHSHCLPEKPQLTLPEFFSFYCTVVVLNNAYQLDDLQALLSALTGALVLLIGEQPYSVSTDRSVVVPELTEEDAKHLIQYVVSTRWHGQTWQLTSEDVNQIYKKTGGNPGAILAEIELYWKSAIP